MDSENDDIGIAATAVHRAAATLKLKRRACTAATPLHCQHQTDFTMNKLFTLRLSAAVLTTVLAVAAAQAR
jgi:hypothetical protein